MLKKRPSYGGLFVYIPVSCAKKPSASLPVKVQRCARLKTLPEFGSKML